MENTELVPVGNIMELAGIVQKSGLVQANVENIAVRMLIGRTLGLEPIQAVLGVDIITIRNRETGEVTSNIFVKPKLLAAKLQQSGKYRYVVKEITREKAEIEFFERVDGAWQSLGVATYTMEEAMESGIAKQGGKVKYNYEKLPKEMLFYRCMQRGISMFCPEVVFGLPLYAEGVEEWGERVWVPNKAEEVKISTEKVEEQHSVDIGATAEQVIEEPLIKELAMEEAIEDEREAFLEEFRNFEIEPVEENEKMWKLGLATYFARLREQGLNENKTSMLFFGKLAKQLSLNEMRRILSFLGLTKDSKPNKERIETLRRVV